MIKIYGTVYGDNSNPLRVITIDSEEVRVREDGFRLVENNLILVCVCYSLNTPKEIEYALNALRINHWTFRHRSLRRGMVGLDLETPHSVIFLKIPTARPSTGQLGICEAIIKVDPLPDEVSNFISRVGGVKKEDAVGKASEMMNSTCEEVFRANGIPFIGRSIGSNNRKLRPKFLLNEGVFSITAPYRWQSSAVNNLQLCHFLRYNEILFSEEKLLSFIN